MGRLFAKVLTPNPNPIQVTGLSRIRLNRPPGFVMPLAERRKELLVNGIAILGALPGSPAAEFGLKYGDILLSVNGIAMSSVEDFLKARTGARGKMELIVRRGSHVMEITLDLEARRGKTIDPLETMKSMGQLSLVPPPAPQEGNFN